MEPFVYESQSVTYNTSTKMSGHFVFEYLEGPHKGKEYKVMVDPFYLKL